MLLIDKDASHRQLDTSKVATKGCFATIQAGFFFTAFFPTFFCQSMNS